MKREPIDFHDEPPPSPEEIDFVSADPGIHLRSMKPGFTNELEESCLRFRSGKDSFVVSINEGPEQGSAGTARVAGEEFSNLLPVAEAFAKGHRQRLFDPAVVDRASEIEERSGRHCHGEPLETSRLVRVQAAEPVGAYRWPGPSTPPKKGDFYGDLVGREGQHLPKPSGATMTEYGRLAAGEYSGRFLFVVCFKITHPVDAAVQTVEASPPNPIVDGVDRHTGFHELTSGDNAVLLRGHAHDRGIMIGLVQRCDGSA